MTTVNQSFLGVSNLVEPLKTLNTGELSVSGALVLDSLNSLDSLEVGKVNTEVVSNAPTMDVTKGTLDSGSTDVAGSFVVTTSPATLEFGKTYDNAPVVLVQNATSGQYQPINTVVSTESNFVVSVPGAALGVTRYNYVVIG